MGIRSFILHPYILIIHMLKLIKQESVVLKLKKKQKELGGEKLLKVLITKNKYHIFVVINR